MANRQIKLSPLAQENGNLVDDNLSKNRRFRNIIRDGKGNETSILQTAEEISLLASSVTEIDGRVTENEASLIIQANQIATKVEQSTFDTLSGRVDTAETSIVQNANAITLKASQSSVDDLTGRVSSAEASITTQAGQIALKAEQTTVDTVSAVANSKAKTFLSTPTTPYYVGDIWIDTNATTGGNKVCTTERLTGAYVAGDWTKEGVTSRIDSAELKITPTAITSTVRSSTEYTNDLGAKENTVFKQNTAPAHLNGRFWLDTSVTPNVLNRSNGTAWIKATPTQASEVGAYSSGQVDTILTSYSTITQTNSSIALEIGKIEVGTTNYLKNSNFANGLNLWINSGSTLDTTDGLGDTSCVLMTGALGATRFVYQDIYFAPNLTGSQEVTLSGFLKGSSVVAGTTSHLIALRIQVIYTDATQTDFIGTESFVGTYNWTRQVVKGSLNPSKTLNFIRIFAFARDFTGTVRFDNIQLELGNKDTQWKPNSSEISGAKYVFDGTNATFTNGGLIIKNNAGTTVFTADVNGNLDITGKITADSGLIADFSLIDNYATIVAGTSGKAITAGSGSNRVGMSPGITSGGFVYSFWAGNDNPLNAPFRVLRNGGLRCTDAVIGGWTMSGTSISRGSTSLNATGTNGTLTIGGGTLSAGSSSQMSYSGAFAITGTTAYSGSINAGTSLINTSGETTRMNYNGQWTATGVRWGVNGGSALSDLRLKHDIKDIDGSFIFKLRPVEFRYDVDGRDLQFGLIAQEVEELLGDNVAIVKKPNEDNEHYGLDYTQLIAPMVATIQSQQKKIDDLEERLAKLEELEAKAS